MAKLENNLIKVVAIYDGFYAETIVLWGVGFVKVNDYYEAELPKEQVDEMVKAGRVAIK
jgi:hypothetical protein